MTQQYKVVDWIEEILIVEPTFPGVVGDSVVVFGEKPNEKTRGLVKGKSKVWVPNLQKLSFTPKVVELVVSSLIPPAFELLVERSFFIGEEPGSLLVKSQLQGAKPGQLQWTLVHYNSTGENQQKIARGDDRFQPGTIEAKFPGWFPPGIYQLDAKLYDNDGSPWLDDRRLWSVTRPVDKLSSGGALDRQLPLFTMKL